MNDQRIVDTKNIVLSGMFIALGVILPFLTMQIPEIGSMLLPMHIPVLLCGFVCGAPFAAIVGFVLPLLRSALFGVPILVPMATAMAVELLFYGGMTGLFYSKLKNVRLGIYLSLIPALVIGRMAWGVAALVLYGAVGKSFTWSIFMSGAFINAIPGILIQIIFIPMIVMYLRKAKLIK